MPCATMVNCETCREKLGTNESCLMCIEAKRVEAISFYEIFDDETWLFWQTDMYDDHGYGRYSKWNMPLKWPNKNWQTKSVDQLVKLAVRYGISHQSWGFSIYDGNAAKIAIKCRKTAEEAEKMTYYWGDGQL